jgi:hypothetical protein
LTKTRDEELELFDYSTHEVKNNVSI